METTDVKEFYQKINRSLADEIESLRESKTLKHLTSAIVLTALPVFLDHRFNWVHEKGGWMVLWIFLALFTTISYIWVKIKEEGPITPVTLRHIALSQRKYFTVRAQKISDWIAEGINVANVKELLNKVNDVLNLDESRHEILREIFNTFSERNRNLNKHFRVTLMEPINDNTLKIVDFANSEDVRPASISQGRNFLKKHTCAGWAWYLKDMFVIKDIDYYRQRIKSFQNTYWEDMPPAEADELKHVGHKSQVEAKSIVSIPIIVNSKMSERVKAIVNIDCDIPYFFNDSVAGRQSVRIRAYPYVRHLAFLYEVKDLIKDLQKLGPSM